MVRSGRSGWYYRVLAEGVLQAGDPVRLAERPYPELPFTRLVAIVNGGEANAADRARIAQAAGVAGWLREAARQGTG